MFFKKKPVEVRLTNTLSGTLETFTPQKPGKVRMYSCGPTVYGPQHIGNLRAAVFSDTLARTLTAAGYEVDRVVNITDVGHLVGDGDEGEDKMAVGAAREQTTPEAIADRYAKQYLADIRALNVDTGSIRFPRATDYIKEQIAMIRALEKKGLAYRTADGVYFDTAHFPDYGILGNMKGVELEAGARVAMGDKKSPHDFVLWRTAKPNDLQQWDSPWGRGNPGWSIECSAMAVKLLGPTLDIHTGGQDHIQVHHNNEIAQSEGATGKKPFSKVWIHNAFLTINGEKISKSLGNTYTLADVTARGMHPLALRYLFLQAHYRSPLSFTWESLAAADEGLRKLWKLSRALAQESGKKEKTSEVQKHLLSYLYNDLGTAQAIGQLWSVLQPDTTPAAERWSIVVALDAVLGLCLTNPPEEPEALTLATLPHEVRTMAEKREDARKNKDFAASDELRIHLLERGYRVEDGPSGSTYTHIQR